MDNKDIVREKTFFEVPLDINTGKILRKDGDIIYDGEDIVGDLNYVIIRFNEKVYNRFVKYFSRVVQQRGIKIVDEIDINDHDVANLINKAKRKHKNGKVEANEISAIIQRVRNLHQPQNLLISFQMILWAILYDDMFDIRGKALDSRFEVDISEYWKGTRLTNDGEQDELDKILSNDMLPPDPFIDQEEPLEIMIAIVTTFLNDHKELSDVIQDYVKKAYVGIGKLRDRDLSSEDAIFLSEQLDELLS